jgi:hypothetical protein
MPMPGPAVPLIPRQSPVPTTAPTSPGPVFGPPASGPPLFRRPPVPVPSAPAFGESATGPAVAQEPAGQSPEPGADEGAADQPEPTEDALPRRVRQANLVPQLRRPAAERQEETVRLRPPEQVRSLMSALQSGTARGRIDASRSRSDHPGGQPGAPAEERPEVEHKLIDRAPSGTSFAEAATVSFPAIVNLAFGRDEEASGTGGDAAGDRADGSEDSAATRPEKDA